MLLNTFNLELSFFSVWFVDPNSKLPEIEDKVNLTFQPREWIYVRGQGFLFSAKNLGKNISSKYGQKTS